MTPLNQTLILILSLSGLLFGYLLAHFTPEELPPGKKWFLLLQKTLFPLIFLPLIIFYLKINFLISLTFIILLLFLFFLFFIKYKEFKYKEILNYLTFILIFYFSLKNPNLLILTASLIFLYGFPTGSLLKLKLLKS